MGKKQELIDNFILLKAQGLSYEKIEAELNGEVSLSTLKRWGNKYYSDISYERNEIRQAHVKQLREEVFLKLEARLKNYRGLYDKLFNELNSRDLTDMKTTDLLKALERIDIQAKCLQYEINNKADYINISDSNYEDIF